MEKLFEQWIANRIASLGAAHGWKVVRQSSKFYLSSWGVKGRFLLIPDLILYRPTGPPVVLDTKWKLVNSVEVDRDRLSENRSVSQGDMYQMNAYLDTIVDDEGRYPTDGILLYPDHSGLPRELSELPFVLGNGKRVWAIGVPLEGNLWGPQSEIEQLIVSIVDPA